VPDEVHEETGGQHLALIYNYTEIAGRSPAEADMQHHFRVTPSSVHQMVLNLENAGLIEPTPGADRSIRVLVQPE
jgi:Mn-dependent DtxR family transcriptional regulator